MEKLLKTSGATLPAGDLVHCKVSLWSAPFTGQYRSPGSSSNFLEIDPRSASGWNKFSRQDMGGFISIKIRFLKGRGKKQKKDCPQR